MKIYIVVACYGGLVEAVKPFLDKDKAARYRNQLLSQKSFTEEEDIVEVYDEGLALPASIQIRLETYLAEKERL